MEPAGDSIILEEEIDPNYEPTEKEVQEYASWLGMDLESEQDLFWIAREGLKAPLPENWKPCKTTDTEEIYYFNFSTGQSTWDHPCDEYYRKVYEDHKKKRPSSARGGGTTEGDERKKKEKEDVAELLGKKGKKKKSSKTTEPLGPPALARGAGLGEKKPLAGLGGSKLNRLSSGSLGSGGMLKPVASLGKLKTELKNDGDGVNLDDEAEDEDNDRKMSLSKPPLGSLLTKKALPSGGLASKAESKGTQDEEAVDFDSKKQKLLEEHSKIFRELSEEHEAKRTAQLKKHQIELDELVEQEEMKLKQRKREFDKKLNDIENQYDKDESNLLRERKEKLKRLESEMELALSHKKQELERNEHIEMQRLQSRLEAKLQEAEQTYDRHQEDLQQKTKSLISAAEMANENEGLKREIQDLEVRMAELQTECEQLKGAYEGAQQDLRLALEEIQKLQIQLQSATQDLDKHNSRAGEFVPFLECGNCKHTLERITVTEGELDTKRKELLASSETVIELQQQIEQLKKVREAEKSISSPVQDKGAEDEVLSLRQLEASLRCDLQTITAKYNAALDEASDWRFKCTALEEEKARLVTSASVDHELQTATTRVDCGSSEVDALRSELADLQDQIAVLTKTNLQVKEQLLKESNEKKQLGEQLGNALANGHRHDLSLKVNQLQEVIGGLEAKMRDENIKRDQLIEAAEAQLHSAQSGAEQEKLRLENEIARLERDNTKINAELTHLKQQIEERALETSQPCGGADQEVVSPVGNVNVEIERLQSALKSTVRDKVELEARVEQLQVELDSVIHTKHQIEVERENEVTRAKKRDADRDELQKQRVAIEEELELQLEKFRAVSNENADLKGQVSKLKFREQSLTDKLAQVGDDLTQSETKIYTQQAELERLGRELRTRSAQLDDKTSAWRESEGAVEALKEQLADARQQLSELRGRAVHGGTLSIHQTGEGAQGNGNLSELRLRVSELESTVETQTQEKTRLLEKHRAAMQNQLSIEASLRSAYAERDRIAEECQSAKIELQKLKERLEKKIKEVEQLRAELFTAVRENEAMETVLNKEREEKQEFNAQRVQLDKLRKELEEKIETLTSELQELQASQGRTSFETQAHHSKLKRAENDLERVNRELRATLDEREALHAKLKQQNTEMAALENRIRLLRSENNEQCARNLASEDDMSRLSDSIKRLETQLEEKETKLRKESEEKEIIAKQVATLRVENEEVLTDFNALKRRNESLEARFKDQESLASRGDFQLKLRLQQLEAERDGLISTKEHLEQHSKSIEKELCLAKEEINILKSDLNTTRAQIKSLTLEKSDLESTLLQAQTAQSTAPGVGFGFKQREYHLSATSDAMLVRLQLADVNKSELEQHLADIATQLELATRRCTLSEARCRDQSVDIETLHVEIASLRSNMAKMHASAIETLPLVERLEYEHKKRTLKRDFNEQLRDFQDREENALMRQKARVRAQHEKQLEELVDELDAKKQRRIEYEEQITVQVLGQLRSERDAQIKEMRRQVESELQEEERTLVEHKTRQLENFAVTLRQQGEEERARQREARQVQREAALTGKLTGSGLAELADQEDRGNASPGQVCATRKLTQNFPNKFGDNKLGDLNRSISNSSSSDDGGQRRQAQKRKLKEYKRWSRSHEREIDQWQQRLSEEQGLLDKVKTLVADEKKALRRQADKIKKEKASWKRDWLDSSADGGHRSAILHEMKTMIDHSTSSWNASMQQVRERDEWIQKREAKLRRMRRTLDSLRARSQSRSRGRPRSNSKSLRVPLSPASSGSEGRDDPDNQTAADFDCDAMLEKLTMLDQELASDASDFASDGQWNVVSTQSQRYSFDRGGYAWFTQPASSRQPLSMALSDGGGHAFHLSDSTQADARLLRLPSHRVRTASATAHASSARDPQRVWPSSVLRRTPYHSGSVNPSDAAVQRRIARWAQGRETMQHAATKQASWLTSLYNEVKAYGDTRARASVEVAPERSDPKPATCEALL